jgi:hypothetical protein
MAEATLREHQSKLLGILTIKAAQRFGAETFLIEEGGVRQVRVACVGDVVLLDHPADATGPRSINCYLVKMPGFAAPPDATRLEVGPDRLLYSLRCGTTPRQQTCTCGSRRSRICGSNASSTCSSRRWRSTTRACAIGWLDTPRSILCQAIGMSTIILLSRVNAQTAASSLFGLPSVARSQSRLKDSSSASN